VDGRSSTGKTGHSRNVGVALTSFDQLLKVRLGWWRLGLHTNEVPLDKCLGI